MSFLLGDYVKFKAGPAIGKVIHVENHTDKHVDERTGARRTYERALVWRDTGPAWYPADKIELDSEKRTN